LGQLLSLSFGITKEPLYYTRILSKFKKIKKNKNNIDYLEVIPWLEGNLAGPHRSHIRRVYRGATIFSPPFVMEMEVFKEDEEEVEEQRCLTGVPCLRVATSQQDELARIFGDYEAGGLSEDGGKTYNLTCCYGFSIDLMDNLASDLDVKSQVYVVADGQCGAKKASKWDAAHLSFAPLSVTVVK